MPRPKRMQQFARSCVFCRRPAKMTNEHVWGSWLKPYVKGRDNKYFLRRKTVGKAGTPDVASLAVKAGASPLHSKVSVVCGDCNHGWLSQIQERSKPHLLPLIEGKERVLIGAKAQMAIATWATMATITAEFIHGRLASIAVSNEAREAFREARAPLRNWRIWIGSYYRRRWEASYVHACQSIHWEGSLVVPNVQDPETPLPTIQWSTFVVGKLYIHTASSSTSPDLIRDWDWRNAPQARGLLVQIWPPKEAIIAWPIRGLTDGEAWRFSHAHWDQLHRETRGQPRGPVSNGR